MSAGTSSLRASDRKGWRLLGRHRQETPVVAKGQGPDRQALAIREAQRRTLREKTDYWQAELVDIEAEFGPEVARRLREFME